MSGVEHEAGNGSAHARVGALDGLRGLAVAAVVLYHSQFGFTRGGFLGVSAFFTLSGFLITSLLLTQTRPDTARLRAASGRGVRGACSRPRCSTLAGVLLFGATVATPDQLRLLRGDVLAALGYVANWRFYLSGQSYAQLFSAPSPVLHFWSLAIEEQFYLVFPLLVAFVAWADRGRRASVRRRRCSARCSTSGSSRRSSPAACSYAARRVIARRTTAPTPARPSCSSARCSR